MKATVYQYVLDRLDEVRPYEWDRLIFTAEEDTASYTYVFYIRSNGTYTQCYSIPGISREQLREAFRDIRKALVEARSENDTWNEMTLVVDGDGHFKAAFDYIDLAEGTDDYEAQWRKKYLI